MNKKIKPRSRKAFMIVVIYSWSATKSLVPTNHTVLSLAWRCYLFGLPSTRVDSLFCNLMELPHAWAIRPNYPPLHVCGRHKKPSKEKLLPTVKSIFVAVISFLFLREI